MKELASIGAPRRRPDGGGYPRGEETRARIVAAALQVFGREGYDRASTRQIADAAGVNPPALQYYFDGKEGLHRACADFIVERITEALSPAFLTAKEALASGDRSRILEAVCGVLDALMDFCLATGDEDGLSRFTGRGQTDGSGPAFALINAGIVWPLHDALSRLIGPLIGRDADDVETRLRTITVLSSLTAFYTNRATTLTRLDWPDFGEGRREIVKAVFRGHLRAALSTEPEPPSS